MKVEVFEIYHSASSRLLCERAHVVACHDIVTAVLCFKGIFIPLLFMCNLFTWYFMVLLFTCTISESCRNTNSTVMTLALANILHTVKYSQNLGACFLWLL